MELLRQTVSIKSFRSKEEAIGCLESVLHNNNRFEYTGTVTTDGTFTAGPNLAKSLRGRGTMPLFYGHVEETGNGCIVNVVFYFPPGVALILLIAEIITGTMGLFMYFGLIRFSHFPVFILPAFGVLTLIFIYAAYRSEVTQATESLIGVVR